MEYYNDYLMHYGVKGMKWGVRRYKNKDGSLTSEGLKKYDAYKKQMSDDNFKKYSEKVYADEERKINAAARKRDNDLSKYYDEVSSNKKLTEASKRELLSKKNEELDKAFDSEYEKITRDTLNNISDTLVKNININNVTVDEGRSIVESYRNMYLKELYG